MGAGCSKACTSSHVGGASGATTMMKMKAQTSHEGSENPFAISIDCFYVPSSRILPHPTALLGPGAGCRSAVVTTIHIERIKERNGNKRGSNLNSAIYTPMIQWFGVDVKQQVPQYLPMNMWPGTYTVFGFYNPEDSGSARVKLIAKVGSQEINLLQDMDTERCLSNERWTTISRLMANELKKLNTPKKRKSIHACLDKETGTDADDSSDVKEETEGQRISQDTGYMSTKRSIVHSPYSLKHIANTSDNEETASLKGKHTCEMKLKFRRKDTPVHGLHPSRLSPRSIDKRDSPLEEESEHFLFSGLEIASSEQRDAIPIRPVSALSRYSIQTPDACSPQFLSVKRTFPLSKSVSDLRDFDNTSLTSTLPHLEDGEDKKRRKKKRSVISKIGSLSPKGDTEIRKDKEVPDVDQGTDADDEADVSFAENTSLTRCDSSEVMSTGIDGEESGNRNTSEDCTNRFTPEDIANPDMAAICDEYPTDHSTFHEQFGKESDINESPDASDMPPIDNDAVTSSPTRDVESKNEDLVCQENERDINIDPMLSTETEIANEKQNKHLIDDISKKEEITEANSTESRKEISDEFDLAEKRPRSRTLSKRYINDDKTYKQRYLRTSKSVCIPPKNINRGEKKKVSTSSSALGKASGKREDRPIKSREAFSDS